LCRFNGDLDYRAARIKACGLKVKRPGKSCAKTYEQAAALN
jgi:hypothetical protein